MDRSMWSLSSTGDHVGLDLHVLSEAEESDHIDRSMPTWSPVGAAWVHTWWALVVTVAAVFVAGTASSSPGEGKPPGGPSKTCACMDTGEHAPLTVAGQIVSLLPARFPLPPCSSP